jgi:hypothetical protein
MLAYRSEVALLSYILWELGCNVISKDIEGTWTGALGTGTFMARTRAFFKGTATLGCVVLHVNMICYHSC